MPKKHTQTIFDLIQRSLLLTEEKKEELLAMVPYLSEPQIERLVEVLKSEENIMQKIIEQGISSVIEHGEKSDLEAIDTFSQSAGKGIRKVEEDVERADEGTHLDSLLDQIS